MVSAFLRALIVAAAVLVAAWLVFSVHAVDLQTDAEATLHRAQHGHVSAADVTRAQALLHRADRHNPDLAPLLDEGFLLAAVGRRHDAFPMALRSVGKEPDNVQSWTLLYLSAPNRMLQDLAWGKVRGLNPWLADSLSTIRGGAD